jgi:hypothetical protein
MKNKLKRATSYDLTDADLSDEGTSDEGEEATLRATDSFAKQQPHKVVPPPIDITSVASSQDVKNAISRVCSWGWFDASTMSTPTTASSKKHHHHHHHHHHHQQQQQQQTKDDDNNDRTS